MINVRPARVQLPARWHRDEQCFTIPNSEGMLFRLLELFKGETVVLHPALAPRGVAARAGGGSAESDADLLARVAAELKLRGYSPRTFRSYLQHVRAFLAHAGKPAPELTGGDVRAYLLARMNGGGISRSYHGQAVSAIKFFFDKVLRRPQEIVDVPRLRKEQRLPSVLSRSEVRQLFTAIETRSTGSCSCWPTPRACA